MASSLWRGLPVSHDGNRNFSSFFLSQRHGYSVETLHIASSWAEEPLVTPPPGFVADAKFNTHTFLFS